MPLMAKKRVSRKGSKRPVKPKVSQASRLRLARVVDTRILYRGDCLRQLANIPDGVVDLIYIDPPFHSGRTHEVLFEDPNEVRAFQDHHGSIDDYIAYMRPRCVELFRVLNPHGTFYFHCDWHAGHYIKEMLDRIFGYGQFRSEIVWRRTMSKGLASRGFPSNHDTIFYYTKGPEFTFNKPFIKYDPYNLDEKTASKYHYTDAAGRRYRLDNLINPNQDRPNLKYEFLGITRVWRWTKERMQQAYEAGRVIQTKPGRVPQYIRYLDEQKGRPVDDMWIDIPPLNSQAAERVGYPTQKPLALVERIIKASSNPGDIVLDAFCGCGTTIEAAEMLDRRWIGIDLSATACFVVSDRLEKRCKLVKDEAKWKQDRGFWVKGLPIQESDLREMHPREFEDWAVIELDGIPNSVKVRDYGIDGRVYPIDKLIHAGKGASGEQLEFTHDMFYPVQAKQKSKVGRPDVDSFQTAMKRAGASIGFLVGFGFTEGAEREIRRAEREEKLTIIPMTAAELIKRAETRSA